MYIQVRAFDPSRAGKEPYLCLKNVRLGYSIPAKYNDAWAAWNATQQHRNRNFPALAIPLYYSFTTTLSGIRRNYGHINVRLADGRVWNDGRIFASLASFENSHSNISYVGWGESVNDVRVIQQGGTNMDKIGLEGGRILVHGILGRNGITNKNNALAGQSDNDINKNHAGSNLSLAHIRSLYGSDEAKKFRSELAKLKTGHDHYLKSYQDSQKALEEANKEIERLRATAGDAGKWETVRVLLRELLGIK